MRHSGPNQVERIAIARVVRKWPAIEGVDDESTGPVPV